MNLVRLQSSHTRLLFIFVNSILVGMKESFGLEKSIDAHHPQIEHHVDVVDEGHLSEFYNSPSFHDSAVSLAQSSPVSAPYLFELCTSNERLVGVYNELVKQSIRYVETILELDYEARNKVDYDPEVVMRKDQERRFAHNAFIDTTNRMSRELAKAGEDNSFFASIITKLPDGSYSRPPYTLFAMQFAMSYYLAQHPELTN